jgi:hypothetical protein
VPWGSVYVRDGFRLGDCLYGSETARYLESRKAFQESNAYDQDSLIEFLKTLQVLPPGTQDLVVDENYRPKQWPPAPAFTPPAESAQVAAK